jgi:hypothetical protein
MGMSEQENVDCPKQTGTNDIGETKEERGHQAPSWPQAIEESVRLLAVNCSILVLN